MKSAFAVVLVATLAAAVAAMPSPQEEPSDELKIFKKPVPLGDLKIFKKPVPLGDLKTYERPVPVPADEEGLEDGTWTRLERFKLFDQPQGLGGAFDWDWAAGAGAPFAQQDPWAVAPAHQAEPLRHKREVCMWLGQKACALKCKFFGRGATQGRCTYGYCECYYPSSYPGNYPGISG